MSLCDFYFVCFTLVNPFKIFKKYIICLPCYYRRYYKVYTHINVCQMLTSCGKFLVIKPHNGIRGSHANILPFILDNDL